MFLIFGVFLLKIYFIKTSANIKIFLITKRQLKIPANDSLRRINNYTFLEL